MERLTLHGITSAFDYKAHNLTKEEATEVYKRLAELEDKIESGLAVELSCKVGDKVYQTDTNGTKIYCSTVQRIIFDGRIVYDTETIGFDKEAIGVSVFLTESAVKAHIKKIRDR